MDELELRKRRCAAGYFTQVAMARKMGMTRANYGNRERGTVRFSAAEIQRMCEYLGLSLEEGLKIMM